MKRFFARCPRCNVRLLSNGRIKNHLRKKCPITQEIRQQALKNAKYEEAERIKRNTVLPSGKILCSHCHTLYIKKDGCAECQRRDLIAQTHVFCGICGGHFKAERIVSHIIQDCRKVALSCVDCKSHYTRGQHHDHEPAPRIVNFLKPPSEPKPISGGMDDPSRYDFESGRCHHCVGRAIPGSTSCFYHGDK